MAHRRSAKKKLQARKIKPQHGIKRSPLFEALEQRHLMAVGPQLLAITPNQGDVLEQGQVRSVAPNQLTFRFDETQTIDAATLATGIRITHGGADKTIGTGDDIIVTPGHIGIGDSPNEVVVRFAEYLPDNDYRILINGSGVIGPPLQNALGDPYADGVDTTVDFSLDLGAQVIAVVPQPMSRAANGSLVQARNQIHVYFNNDDLDPADAIDVDFYQLYLTNDTATTADDLGPFKPTGVAYDATNDRAILTFANDLATFGEGNYRLRIGNDQGLAPAPIVTTMPSESDPTANENSSFNTASIVGPLSNATQVIQSAIDPQRFTLQLPGGSAEIGHRQIQFEHHLLDLPDFTDGVSTIYYNFQKVLTRDFDGFPEYVNIITEAQMARAREIFEILGQIAGVQFVETPDTEEGARGITVATGDLAAMGGTSNAFGTLGIAGIGPHGLPMAMMDAGETGGLWGDSEFGGNYMLTAMHEILHLLNLGHANELPPLTVMASFLETTTAPAPNQQFENTFPGSADIIHLKHVFRPESKDIDVYQFALPTAGRLQLETIAERLTNSSLLDTVISLYDASGSLIARNDDYFSEDSFVDVELESGTYYVAVTAAGNTDFDLNVEDSGFGGTTQGEYELRINFDPAQTTGLRDTTGTLLDGDQDGRAGGYHNFWFAVASEANTIYVDKAGPTTGNNGSRLSPYRFIDQAFAAAQANANKKIVRIVGNGGSDNNPATNNNDFAYEIGVPLSGGVRLQDGVNMRVPQGVTVMVDEGAIFKLRRAKIDVGSFSQGIDSSLGHLQLLGTPTNNVIITSYHNEQVGLDTFALPTTPVPGDWGGIVFYNDLDREEGRTILEDEGIFLNVINHADISYGGGELLVNNQQRAFSPIEMVEARPTITFSRIERAANAALSADPNSFAETLFRDNTYERDYRRVGPDIYHNTVVNNTINALFVRIDTLAGEVLDRMTVQGRFDDDIVHVISEALIIQGTPGGPTGEDDGLGNIVRTARTDGRLVIDPGIIVKMKDARIEVQVGAQLIAEGLDLNEIVFTSLTDDRFGASGTFDTSTTGAQDAPAPGDWGGLFFNYFSEGSIDHALVTFAGGDTPTEGQFSHFNPVEIHGANVRIANTTFERNEDGIDLGNDDRNGRGINTPAVIFVRNAQPILVDNLFQDNIANNVLPDTASRAPAISIDVNSLNSSIIDDFGRSRGFLGVGSDLPPNRGALIRGNLIDSTDINGMVVRGGELTTQGVWDDTDITHVVFDEIITGNHHTLSGLRLESKPTESLVVKLFGQNAGFTAEGTPLEISDRVGGTLQVIGAPSRPVVFTSLLDDSVGAGRDTNNRPFFDTNNDGINTSAGGGTTEPPAVSPGPVRVTGTTTNANALRDALLGTGITPVGNATYVGGANSAGFFVGGSDSIGIPTGIVLSTGDANDAAGPNVSDATSGDSSLVGDADLDVAFGTTTFDTTYLEFDFTTTGGDLFFNFVFASEEYNDFVNLQFNDVFAFFLDGVNIALVPNTATPIAINNVNNGNPLGVGASNPQFYQNNDLDDAGQFLNQVEYNGFTSVFTAAVFGLGAGVHRIKMAISDVEDELFDSAVFLQAGTFSDTPPGAAAGAGDWRSLLLDTFSNDRNFEAVNEFERIVFDVDTNGSVDNSQFLGELAANEQSSDDNLRLGFEVRGTLARVNPGDVDVYSFTARPGTEVWIDIDNTTQSLDTVVELINANGVVLARSDNSVDEAVNAALLFGAAREMQRSELSPIDYGTTNPRDAGMRVVLPGQIGGNPTDYFIRVRSKADDINDLNGGKTTGQYTLQLRLRELDEIPGSTIRSADIRFATTGIEVPGKPTNSPLIGEAGDSEPFGTAGTNNSFANAQLIGNLFQTNQGTLAVSGNIGSTTDIDWYRFDVDVQDAQGGALVNIGSIFDIDYSDGFGRPDVRISVFDVNGNLILSLDDSNIADDRPAPEENADLDDLTRGSIGGGDPFLGTVNLVNGDTYYVAVSHAANRPTEITTNPLLRLEPINSLTRIVEDHIGDLDVFGNPISSVGTPANTIFNRFNLNAHVSDYFLGDVVLYVMTGGDVFTVDPFTGDFETDVGIFLPDVPAGISYGDMAMRSDGGLYMFTKGSTNFNLDQNALSGNYRQISTENLSLISSNDDGIVTFQLDPMEPFDPDDGTQNPLPYNRGVQFEALVHGPIPTRRVWAVGNIPLDGPAISPPPLIPFTRNLLYEFDSNGNVINNPADPDPDDDFSPTDANPRGVLNTGPTLTLVPASDILAISQTTGAVNDPLFGNPGDILDGTRFTVTDIPGATQIIFELDSGPDVRTSARGPEDVRDGDFFILGDGTDTLTFEYESGPVIDIPYVIVGGQRIAGSQINDGDTFTIFDNAGVPVGIVFEFNDTTLAAPGNELNNATATEISFTPADDLATVVASVLTAINGAAFNVEAEPSVLDITTNGFVTNFGRITLRNDTQASGAYLDGARGTSIPGSIPLNFEETDDFEVFLENTTTVVDTFLNGLRVGYAARTGSNQFPGSGTTGDRMTFFGAINADFSGVPSFTHVNNNGAGAISTPGGAAQPSATGIRATSQIQVPFDAGDTAFDLAAAIAQAINFASTTVFPGTFDVEATAIGVQVEIDGVNPNVPLESDAATRVNPSGDNGPGGLITGLALIGTTMYAVTDAGGLYIVNNYSAFMDPVTGTGGASLDYIETSADDLLGIEFSGLAAGPNNVENGRYANMLFATDVDGNVYAFNTSGVLQPIFFDGATSIDTGIQGLQGLDFSTLDYNLWHASTRRAADAGHGVNPTYDETRSLIPAPGGTDIYNGGQSFYFGYEGQIEPLEYQASMFGTYNMPGGAHGSLTSDTFSLADYSPTDQPVLYFTYFLAGNDLASVSISNDGANWETLPAGLVSNSGVWRQARIELGDYVGMSDLRLRFDFTTGASVGDLMQALPGTGLNDGEFFSVDPDDNPFTLNSIDFEFDMGFSLLTPTAAGYNIADGDAFTVTGPGGTATFEFNKVGGTTGTPIDIIDTDSAVDVARKITNAVNAAGLGITARRHEDRVHLQNASVLDAAAAPTLTVLGDAPGQTDPGAQPIVVHLGMTAEQVAFLIGQAFDQVFTNSRQIQAVPGSQLTEAMTFTINDGNQTVTFEFDELPADDGVIAGRQDVNFNPADSAAAIATAIANAINQANTAVGLNVTATTTGSRVNLDGAVVFFRPGSSTLTDPGNFDDANFFTSVKVDGALIQTEGNSIEITDFDANGNSFAGPLPYNTYARNPNGGVDNNHEGFYIDDIIIGFAERGEMVTGANANTTFASDIDPTIIYGNTGPYDLEIRQGTSYTLPGIGLSNIVKAFDTNDRLTNAFTFTAPAGVELHEGETFSINDGLRVVTFEFDTDGIGASPTNLLVEFDNAITATEVATLMRDAINAARSAGLTTVSASVITGSKFVQVFGAQAVDTRSFDVNTTNLTTESNDTIDNAVDSTLSSENPGTIRLKGVIGDNYEINSSLVLQELWGDTVGIGGVVDGLDVDMIAVQLDAGDRLIVDVDIDHFGSVLLDAELTIYDASGQVVDFDSIFLSAPGEPDTLITSEPYIDFIATATDTYYIAISGINLHNSDPEFDPFEQGSGEPGTIGEYEVQITVGPNAGVSHTQYDLRGDSNQPRAQGYTLIRNNIVTESAGFGIVVDSSPRDATGSQTYPGVVRNLREINTQRLVPGVDVENNVLAFNGTGGILISGDSNANTGEPLGGVPFVRVVNNTIVGTALNNNAALVAPLPPANSALTEPNDTLVTARNGGNGNFRDSGVIGDNPNLTANPSLDVDLYRVTLAAGQTIQIDVDANETGGDLDAILRIFNSTGTQLRINDNAVGPAEQTSRDPYLIFTAPSSGTYFIGVSGANNSAYNPNTAGSGTGISSTGPYQIFVTPFIPGGTGMGIRVNENASPTLLNNVFADLATAIEVSADSNSTIVGGSAYRNNTTNLQGALANPQSFVIQVPVDEQLFINASARNFYPAANSRIIDSSLNILQERFAMTTVTNPIGIAPSPILAPLYDLLGQFRINDPSATDAPGLGSNVFKDRGAIERADFSGPTAELLVPEDNEPGVDLDSTVSVVSLEGEGLAQFQIQLIDGVAPNDPAFGAGIDDLTVDSSKLVITRNGVALVENFDYRFSYDTVNDTIALETLQFRWEPGVYVITINNSASNGIRDLAGNGLKANQLTGETMFTISIGTGLDFGDAPAPFPTSLADDGARHSIVVGYHLGATVTDEEDALPLDNGDDGVIFANFELGATGQLTITSSGVGFVDAWIDFNGNDSWDDAGEQILMSFPVVAGLNVTTVNIPLFAATDGVAGRFRLSSTGGLLYTGQASDGEVEDYIIDIGGNPWQNADNPYDINDDNVVDTLDLAMMVNDLKVNKSRLLQVPRPSGTLSQGFVDINGDGIANTVDLAFLVNQLGKRQFAEGNDTLMTANNRQSKVIAASPTDVVAGYIGDNVLGSLDVDLIRLVLNAGDQLSIDVDASRVGSPLDSVLRVFNSAGMQLAISDNNIGPGEGPESATDSFFNFVVPTTGTYFIGVSGGGNTTYNPAAAGSGTSPTGNLGYYELLLQLTPNPVMPEMEGELISAAEVDSTMAALAAVAGETPELNTAVDDEVDESDVVFLALDEDLGTIDDVDVDADFAVIPADDDGEAASDDFDSAFAELEWELA